MTYAQAQTALDVVVLVLFAIIVAMIALNGELIGHSMQPSGKSGWFEPKEIGRREVTP